jgi:hypothetical protein
MADPAPRLITRVAFLANNTAIAARDSPDCLTAITLARAGKATSMWTICWRLKAIRR